MITWCDLACPDWIFTRGVVAQHGFRDRWTWSPRKIRERCFSSRRIAVCGYRNLERPDMSRSQTDYEIVLKRSVTSKCFDSEGLAHVKLTIWLVKRREWINLWHDWHGLHFVSFISSWFRARCKRQNPVYSWKDSRCSSLFAGTSPGSCEELATSLSFPSHSSLRICVKTLS